MTVEQKAEEYVMREDVITENDRVPFDNGYGFQTVSFEDEVKQAFIDGYHECQKEHEWHYVKNGDLPKEEREYIVMNANEGGDTSYWICYYWKEEKKFTGYGLGEVNVIKWKEIE